MGKLRKTIQREIYDILDSSIFTSDDFNINFGDPDSNQFLIEIIFKYDDEFSYKIRKRANDYFIIETPGTIEESESFYVKHYEEAISPIHDWCTEVRNELKAVQPIYNELDSIKEMIEEHFIRDSNNKENEFSVEEINNLQQKFEDLRERVETLEKDKIITENQSTEIQSGLQKVKEDIEYYPKETWIKTSSNKILNLFIAIGKSKEGRKVLADGSRKLLGLD